MTRSKTLYTDNLQTKVNLFYKEDQYHLLVKEVPGCITERNSLFEQLNSMYLGNISAC